MLEKVLRLCPGFSVALWSISDPVYGNISRQALQENVFFPSLGSELDCGLSSLSSRPVLMDTLPSLSVSGTYYSLYPQISVSVLPADPPEHQWPSSLGYFLPLHFLLWCPSATLDSAAHLNEAWTHHKSPMQPTGVLPTQKEPVLQSGPFPSLYPTWSLASFPSPPADVDEDPAGLPQTNRQCDPQWCILPGSKSTSTCRKENRANPPSYRVLPGTLRLVLQEAPRANLVPLSSGSSPHLEHSFHVLLEWSQFSSVQLLSHVRLFATPWTAARQASLTITNSRSLLKPISTESVIPSNYLIFEWSTQAQMKNTTNTQMGTSTVHAAQLHTGLRFSIQQFFHDAPPSSALSPARCLPLHHTHTSSNTIHPEWSHYLSCTFRQSRLVFSTLPPVGPTLWLLVDLLLYGYLHHSLKRMVPHFSPGLLSVFYVACGIGSCLTIFFFHRVLVYFICHLGWGELQASVFCFILFFFLFKETHCCFLPPLNPSLKALPSLYPHLPSSPSIPSWLLSF